MHPRQAAAGSSSSAKPSPGARAVTSPRLAAAGDVAARDAPGRRDRRTRAREGKALERRDRGRPITCRSDSLTGRPARKLRGARMLNCHSGWDGDYRRPRACAIMNDPAGRSYRYMRARSHRPAGRSTRTAAGVRPRPAAVL